MQITNSYMRIVQKGAVMAIVDIILDRALVVKEIKILHSRTSGPLRLVFPSFRQANGSFADLVSPIDHEARRYFTEELVGQYETICAEQGLDVIPSYRNEEHRYEPNRNEAPPPFPTEASQTDDDAEVVPSAPDVAEEVPQIVCAGCPYHGRTGENLVLKMEDGTERFFKGVKACTHYCMGTKSGRRIIVNDKDWHEGIRPYWCPRQTIGQ